ncbi:hypothetical protein DY000_02015373 [Brassica cretica]|uniref:Uncharacterized protein n=1 Tax=Brassica cretica TaxID=69181 RepID=A0ABQ7CWL0_BRACR|nr:hypothetical protein DY000_02015373 [Brassica cretica]
MINECGSETSRLARELLELQGRWSKTEAMLMAVKGSHSVKVSKFEIVIGELERDLGKTAGLRTALRGRRGPTVRLQGRFGSRGWRF